MMTHGSKMRKPNPRKNNWRPNAAQEETEQITTTEDIKRQIITNRDLAEYRMTGNTK
jgi:hypothetical protein